MERAYENGEKKGKREGKREGKKEISIKIAKEMIKKGFDIKEIIELTWLDEDEVIDVESWELKDLLELIYKGKMTDAKTVAAITAYAVKYGTDNN